LKSQQTQNIFLKELNGCVFYPRIRCQSITWVAMEVW